MATGLSFSATTRSVTTSLERTSRGIFLTLVVTTLMSICMFRLAQLQLVQGQHHRQLAEQNRLRLIPIVADRGNLLDRKGRLLASNRLSRSVYLWPRSQPKAEWQVAAKKLGPILDVPAPEILKKLEQAGYDSPMPVRIRQNLNPNGFVQLAEQVGDLPGLEIRAESARNYPNGSLAAHVMGYIGEATADELKANPHYPMGMIVGQMGLERILEKQLQGVWGNRLIEVDAAGKEIQVLGNTPTQAGEPVKLTLDLDLQKAAEQKLANRRGAVVALDVKTGAILALASGPTFDPNLFTRKISTKDWDRLQATDKPFLNRVFQGYPPGSTFKLVTAIAGLESGKFSPSSTLLSSSYITVGGFQFHEHGSGYGVIGFPDAFAYSSNTFFYQIGLAVGPEQISKWSKRLGIGQTEVLGFEGAGYGSVPTPAEKEKLYGEPWYGGDTVSMSIGQGVVQVTPVEMAVMYAAIGNGGWRVKPHLLTSETNTPATKPEKIGLSPSTIATVRQGLVSVVQKGTAKQLNDGSIPLTAGKTGTAEVVGQEDNAVYVGIGPAKDPQIAVAVVVENGGFGAVSAVPIAHEVYKAYFKPTKSASPKPSK